MSYDFIEDKEGRKLYYVLRLAENPEQARTVFILHGQGFSKIPSSFKDANWNVICPLDQFGVDNGGTWFLGEDSNFFIKELMLQLIEDVKRITKSDRLYFWGSSMGGYAAIFYGLLCGAEAILANVPQIKLRYTEYTDDNPYMRKCLHKVLGEDFPFWIDLTALLESTNKDKYPLFFITQTRFHQYNYLKEHIYYFIHKCEELGVNYFLEIVPKRGHLMYKSVAESMRYFDDYSDDIEGWVKERKLKVDYKNKVIRFQKAHENDNTLKIELILHSDNEVGEKDLLLSFNPDYFKVDNEKYYGLILSPNPSFGLFRYIPTKVGIYSVDFDIPLPQDISFFEFSILEFYPKGKTSVRQLRYSTFKK